jgi:O-antigen/teichoic acid export membrane protein
MLSRRPTRFRFHAKPFIGLTGQAASALQNFLLFSIAAHRLSPEQLGWFVVALTLHWLLFGLVLAVVTDPLLLRSGSIGVKDWCTTANSAIGLTIVVTIPASLLLLLVATLASHPFSGCLVACAAILPVLGCYELVRTTYLARARPSISLGMDLVWIGTWLVLVSSTHSGPSELLAGWGLTALPPTLFLVIKNSLKQGTDISSFNPRSALRLTAGIRRVSLIEYFATAATSQVFIFTLPLILPVSQIGNLRAAQTLLAPLNTLFNALRFVVTPGFSTDFHQTGRVHPLRVITLSGLLTGTAAALCIGTVFLPESLGQLMFNDTWDGAKPFIMIVALQKLLGALAVGPALALRVSDRFNLSATVRVTQATFSCGVGLALTYYINLRCGLAAVAFFAALEAIATWVLWHRHCLTPSARYPPAVMGASMSAATEIGESSAHM